MSVANYDLIVIGRGPAGEKGAAEAAYCGKRVALVERSSTAGRGGGECQHPVQGSAGDGG